MKKLLFTTLIAVLSLVSVNAQDKVQATGFAKGDVYVSGSLNFASVSVAGADSTSAIEFSPSVGYFVSDNIAVEALLMIGSIKDTSSNFGFGLGANYFFTPASKFSFTVGAALAYDSESYEGTDVKLNQFSIAVAPGVNYFISEAFALRASIGALGYSSSKYDFDGAEATTAFALSLDLSDVNFGLTYKF